MQTQRITSKGAESQSPACSVDMASIPGHGLMSAFALKHRRLSKRSTVFKDHTCKLPINHSTMRNSMVVIRTYTQRLLAISREKGDMGAGTMASRATHQRHRMVAGGPFSTVRSDLKR